MRLATFFFRISSFKQMPNFGRLTDDLFCRTLTVGDRMVLDQNLNLIVGNVIAGNLQCALFTSKIVEESSLSGITVYGNLHIQSGSYLTGDIDLTGVMFEDVLAHGNVTIGGFASVATELFVDKITSKTQPVLTGPMFYGNTTVASGKSFAADLVETNALASRSGSSIQIYGNLLIDENLTVSEIIAASVTGKVSGLGPLIIGNTVVYGTITADALGCEGIISAHRLICDGIISSTLLTDQLSGRSGDQLDIVGNVSLLTGTLTTLKSVSGPHVSNTISGNTPSGIAIYSVTANTAPQLLTLTMQNEWIQGNSLVLATIGNYEGNALPFIQQTLTTLGSVVFKFLTLNEALAGETIPIQYVVF